MSIKEQLEKYKDDKTPIETYFTKNCAVDFQEGFNRALELLYPLVEACQEINEWRVGDNPASKALQELREKLEGGL